MENLNKRKIIQNIIKKQTTGKLWIIDELIGDIENIVIKDCSKGCDNLIYIVSPNQDNDNDNDKIIIRIPKRIELKECPIMHRPYMQARLLEVIGNIGLNEINIQVPKLISLDKDNDKYMIESYIPYQDLSQIFSKPYEMNDNQCNDIFSTVGSILYRIHNRIKTPNGTYGSIINQQLTGELSSWNDFFENDYITQFETMEININEMNNTNNNNNNNNHQFKNKSEVIKLLNEIYWDVRNYLINFKDPSLVHADLCSNNIRVSNDINDLKVIGIIDFSDSISGDGLYDIGRILSHCYGDFRFVKAIETGYHDGSTNQQQQFSNQQIKLIIFYALSFCCWLLDVSNEPQDIKKYNNILSTLLTLYINKK